MYASPPPLAEATATLWGFLSETLMQAGLDEVPPTLDDAVDYHQAWTRPDLLLAQTCGFPYVKHLRGKVKLVATPVYGIRAATGRRCAASLSWQRIVLPNPWKTCAVRGRRSTAR